MANDNLVEESSTTGHVAGKVWDGVKKGLAYGVAAGLGAGILLSGVGILLGTMLPVGGVALAVGLTMNGAVLGTAIGAAAGALKGLLTKPRPAGTGAAIDIPAPDDTQPIYSHDLSQVPTRAPQQAPVKTVQPDAELRRLTDELRATQAATPSAPAVEQQNWRNRVSAGRTTESARSV